MQPSGPPFYGRAQRFVVLTKPYGIEHGKPCVWAQGLNYSQREYWGITKSSFFRLISYGYGLTGGTVQKIEHGFVVTRRERP